MRREVHLPGLTQRERSLLVREKSTGPLGGLCARDRALLARVGEECPVHRQRIHQVCNTPGMGDGWQQIVMLNRCRRSVLTASSLYSAFDNGLRCEKGWGGLQQKGAGGHGLTSSVSSTPARNTLSSSSTLCRLLLLPSATFCTNAAADASRAFARANRSRSSRHLQFSCSAS